MTKAFVSAALGGAVIYFHAIIVPLVVLMLAMTADYLTGMAKAWYRSELSSDIGRKGIVKKLGCLMSVCVAAMIDWLIVSGLTQVGINIKISYCVGIAVTIWHIINELISILENLDAIGVPMPKFIKNIIKHLKKHIDELGGHEDE